MATPRPLLRLSSTALRPRPLQTRPTKRTFLSSLLPGGPDNNKSLQINVSRTLPYPRAKLYSLIADVDSYSHFLPYCKHSQVTAWAPPPPSSSSPPPNTSSTHAPPPSQQQQQQETGTKGPERSPIAGVLSLGWGPLDHTYTSRIVCAPGHSVEAHSGDDEPLCREADEKRGYKNPFRKLSTRWTLRDDHGSSTVNGDRQSTRVDLDLSMTLRDVMTQAVLSQMIDGVAQEMIQAFEKRAEQLFGRNKY